MCCCGLNLSALLHRFLGDCCSRRAAPLYRPLLVDIAPPSVHTTPSLASVVSFVFLLFLHFPLSLSLFFSARQLPLASFLLVVVVPHFKTTTLDVAVDMPKSLLVDHNHTPMKYISKNTSHVGCRKKATDGIKLYYHKSVFRFTPPRRRRALHACHAVRDQNRTKEKK